MNVVIVNCFDTYEHRVDLLYSFFKSRGDQVKVYTSTFRHFDKVERTDKKEDFVYIKANPYYKNMSPKRLWSHHELSKSIFRRLENEAIDLLWILIPPNSFTKDAAKYKKRHPNKKLIFDVIDMWPETMPVKRIEKLPPIQMWKGLRDKWIDAADHIVTECSLYHTKLKVDKKKLSTIYLAREIKPFIGNPNPPEDKCVLCYLGSINNIIDIPTIGNIVKELSKKKPVTLHVVGDGERRDELIFIAKEAGAEVIYHGKVYDAQEKQQIFDSCHYGLNIMKDSVFVGLTMKSIDYFEAGLPIINNIHGDTWDMVEKYGIGVNIDTSCNIRKSITDRKTVREFYVSTLSVQSFNRQIESALRNT